MTFTRSTAGVDTIKLSKFTNTKTALSYEAI